MRAVEILGFSCEVSPHGDPWEMSDGRKVQTFRSADGTEFDRVSMLDGSVRLVEWVDDDADEDYDDWGG